MPGPQALSFPGPTLSHVRSAHLPGVSCLHPSFLSPVSPLLPVSCLQMQGSWGKTPPWPLSWSAGAQITHQSSLNIAYSFFIPLTFPLFLAYLVWDSLAHLVKSFPWLISCLFQKTFLHPLCKQIYSPVTRPQHSHLGSECSRMSNSAGDSYPPTQS